MTSGVVTPSDLLARVREAHEAEERAGVDLLVLAIAWAEAHPADPDDPTSQWWRPVKAATRSLDDDGGLDPAAVRRGEVELEDLEWFGIPPVAWSAPAAFAAAHHVTTASGKALIRDALVLEHRLPRTWARVLGGGVAAWRARRAAQAVLGAAPDVVAYLDERVHRVVGTIGRGGLERLLDDAMLELHAEERELEQIEALDARHATLHHESLNHTGIAEMTLRADWADLDDLDKVPSVVAAALKTAGAEGEHDSLDVRRARAIGVLADPARALALLHPDLDPDRLDTGAAPPPAPRREIVAYYHLSPESLSGLQAFVRDGLTLRQVVEAQVRAWCGRSDRYLRVQPVIDLHEAPSKHATRSYEPPDALRERVLLRHPTCVFPWCERPATHLDLDHVVAYPDDPDPQGPPPTSELNLAPLCRHHHQLKTHAGWSYVAVDPLGPHPRFWWREPHGLRFLRTPHGTTDLTGPAAPLGGSPVGSTG